MVAFKELFSILSTWDAQGELTLDISFYSPSDSQHWYKYLTFLPDTPAALLNGDGSEKMLVDYHDPKHGWEHGSRQSLPPQNAIKRILHALKGEMLDTLVDLLAGFPSVTAVTRLLLRQQNRRRWERESLEYVLHQLPRLQELHYEPWRHNIADFWNTDAGGCHSRCQASHPS